MKVTGKVVVVTGGGNGIGREMVLELLRRGARVAAVDLRKDSLDEVVEAAAAGDRLATFPVDVTDDAAVAALPEQVASALGPADAVAHVAGIIQPFVRLVDLDDVAMRRVVDVNLYGTLHVVRAFLPGLLRRPVAHVAIVSSMGGYLPVPGQTVYGATKAAVKLLAEGLYAELRHTDVGVTAVMPGAVTTDIAANSGVAVPDLGDDSRYPATEPEDAARTIVDAIEANRLHVYVGRDARLMNLLVRIAPKQATHLIQRQMRGLLGSP